jgi:uncharacterized membrane protein
MRLDVVLAILAMTVVTYTTRAGGYLLLRTFRPNATVRAALNYIPGALFVAYVAPALAHGGWPEWCGAGVTVATMLATRQMSVAVLAGTAGAWLVWAVR